MKAIPILLRAFSTLCGLIHAVEFDKAFREQQPRTYAGYPGSEYDPQAGPFWPAIVREKGCQAAYIGKWHSGRDIDFGGDWDHQMVWNRPKHPANAPNDYHYQPQLFH